ncbi:MAG: maleylpyruvate isomerase family mycothiol-dependent enzyme [Mycobacterium sp.]|nr:maleylpyruvate isomerase family mycothiol-dependent enzyme [Mycobacterium sp.]
MSITYDSFPGHAMSAAEAFGAAADHFVALVSHIPSDRWDGPATCAPWTVRTLAGHTGRALSTIVSYLSQPATECNIHSAADYYLAVAERNDPQAITSRAQQAGIALGHAPAEFLHRSRDRAVDVLANTVGDPLISTAVGGMRLSDYLPTRTFELAVHSVDLARSLGVPDALPGSVTSEVLALATEVVYKRGDGHAALLALTGRAPLPGEFTFV